MGKASAANVATLPPTLEVLDISWNLDVDAILLAHLPRLRVFHAALTPIDDCTVAALPASLGVLTLWGCHKITPAASFTHLGALRTLDIRGTGIAIVNRASLPPSLVSLKSGALLFP